MVHLLFDDFQFSIEVFALVLECFILMMNMHKER